jgi:hypothetical protein
MAHLITPIELYLSARCVTSADGWTDAEFFGAPGGVPAGFGSYTPFPQGLAEASENRILFGVCCRTHVTVNLDVTLNGTDPVTAEYRITLIENGVTTTVWSSLTAGITVSGNIPVSVDLDPGPCGSVIQIDALDGADSGSTVLITITV